MGMQLFLQLKKKYIFRFNKNKMQEKCFLYEHTSISSNSILIRSKPDWFLPQKATFYYKQNDLKNMLHSFLKNDPDVVSFSQKK